MLSINSTPVNSSQLNGTGIPADPLHITGSGVLLTLNQRVQSLPAGGEIIVLSQVVGVPTGGTLITLNQTVELHQTAAGKLLAVDQSVSATATGIIARLAQRVRRAADDYQFKQPDGALLGWDGFDLTVSVGGNTVDDMLTGDVTITRREGDSTLATIMLIPPMGVQNINQYHGKSVIITASAVNRSKIIYTGVVDVPEIDIINETITLQCTDSRTEKNNALSESFVRGVGYYSDAVFSSADDLNAELEQRLETIPYAWDYATDGTGRLTAWEPKSTPDYILTDESIFRRNPSVTVLSRGRVTNKITCTFTYNYQLLRHRERNYSFDSGLWMAYYDIWGLPPSNIDLKQAIDSAGWPYDNYNFEGLDPAGRYTINGVSYYWSPITRTGDVVATQKKDANGNPVVDQNGEPVYDYNRDNQTSIDNTNLYAQKAAWKASKRWSQNITETIECTLQAPQSIAQYGEVSSEVSYGTADEYDASDWENYIAHANPPSSATQTANGDYVIKKTTDINAFNNMVLTGLNREKTKIIKGHRDNRVNFETPAWPDVELFHTIQTTADKVTTKGKVSEIKHTFDTIELFASTEIELSLSQSIGSTTNDPIVLPARPALVDSTNTPSTIKLGTHTIPLGGAQDPDWAGYIFQELKKPGGTFTLGAKTPVAMIVDTPAIEDESRDTKEIAASKNYNIEIRNDLLQVTFDGK